MEYRYNSAIEALPRKVMDQNIQHGNIVFFTWKNEEKWPVEHVSSNVSKLLGVKPKQFLSGEIVYSDLIHPNDLSKVSQEVEEAMIQTKDEFTHDIYRIKHADGNYRHIYDHTKVIRNADNEVTHFVGYLFDNTEVIKQQERVQLVLEGGGIGLWDWNPQTNEVIFDKRWANMLGYELSELPFTLEAWEIRVHPDDLPGCRKDIQDHIEGKTDFYQNIHRMKHKNGEWHYIWDRGRVVEWDNNCKPIRFTGTHTDITKQKIAELKSIESMKAREQFFALMSHEIRSPLNVLTGALDLLKEEGISDKQKQMFDVMDTSSTLLKNTIDDVLQFNKLESNDLSLEEVSFSLYETIDESIRLFKEQCISKNISINKSYPCHQDWFIGDPLRVRQIINNLISNAVKFTEEGDIFISVCCKADEDLKINISDSGIGISQEHLDNIFSPFRQAESSTTRNFGGTGLGLYIAKELCRLMEGNLTVESLPAKGSIFTVTLPLKQVQPITSLARNNDTVDFTKEELSSKILLVDDSEDNQLIMSIKLKNKGFVDLTLLENGQLAVDYLQSNECDLVIMDCMMPVKDGYQASTELKENPKTKTIPIVALTANAMEDDQEKCQQAGMDDYLAKPIDFKELFGMMKKYL